MGEELRFPSLEHRPSLLARPPPHLHLAPNHRPDLAQPRLALGRAAAVLPPVSPVTLDQ